MKKTWKEIDQVLEGWLKEHKHKRISGQIKGDHEHDFMDMMLNVLDDAEDQLSDYDADTINKATCLALILGGTDTTMLTLANLLHGFEFSTPNDELVDMADGMGLTNLKATPLEVLLIPRLPAHLY
ncbi:hypothetical protein Q3G72_033213 [Acer saccharum]|nr:hypothetical protein Q3G72_033213 [Acer saccharum]